MYIKRITTYEPTFLANGNLLKKLYKRGKLPIKHGIYGGELTIDNVSNEHIKPKSCGGKLDITNIALATKENNNKRGNDDIRNYLTPESLKQYIDEILSVKTKKFDKFAYVRDLLKTINDLIDSYK